MSRREALVRWLCCLGPLERRVAALEHELDGARGELAKLRDRDWSALDAASAVVAQYECKICMERPIESAFAPCGHALCCLECARAMPTCPLCAARVGAVTRIRLM